MPMKHVHITTSNLGNPINSEVINSNNQICFENNNLVMSCVNQHALNFKHHCIWDLLEVLKSWLQSLQLSCWKSWARNHFLINCITSQVLTENLRHNRSFLSVLYERSVRRCHMVTSSFSARLVAEPFLEGTAEKLRHHLSGYNLKIS